MYGGMDGGMEGRKDGRMEGWRDCGMYGFGMGMDRLLVEGIDGMDGIDEKNGSG